MYIARFSYSIKPVDRERALALLRQEVEAARGQGLEARLLVPLTRPRAVPRSSTSWSWPTWTPSRRSARRGWAVRRVPAPGCAI